MSPSMYWLPDVIAFLPLKQDYYGNILKNTSDLKSNVCTTPSQPIPAFIRQALKKVHPDVSARWLTVVILLLLWKCLHWNKATLRLCKPEVALLLKKQRDVMMLQCVVLPPSGTMAVGWWCQRAWRAAGFWTWAVAVGETATCWVSWWARTVMWLALTWLRTRYFTPASQYVCLLHTVNCQWCSWKIAAMWWLVNAVTVKSTTAFLRCILKDKASLSRMCTCVCVYLKIQPQMQQNVHVTRQMTVDNEMCSQREFIQVCVLL